MSAMHKQVDADTCGKQSDQKRVAGKDVHSMLIDQEHTGNGCENGERYPYARSFGMISAFFSHDLPPC